MAVLELLDGRAEHLIAAATRTPILFFAGWAVVLTLANLLFFRRDVGR